MQKRTIFSIFILGILSLTIFSSCQKTFEKQIVGEWKTPEFSDTKPSSTWIFYDDGMLEVIHEDNCGGRDTCIGGYSIDASFFVPYITLYDFGFALDGEYKADKLTNSKLSMTRIKLEDGSKGGAFLRREFTKQ